MTDRKHRSAKDVGSDSPASEEAKEQTRSGMQGAPRGKGETGGADRQPPQSSGRSGRGPRARARKHYYDDERPSAQADGDPSPRRISGSPGQQGLKGAGGAGRASRGRGEDEATVE